MAWNATAPLRGSITSFGGLNNILSFFRGNEGQPAEDVPKTHRGQHVSDQQIVQEDNKQGDSIID